MAYVSDIKTINWQWRKVWRIFRARNVPRRLRQGRGWRQLRGPSVSG